jgi:hypothetical protein
MTMPPTVVYVHGNGNQPSASALKNSWDGALFGAPAAGRSVMAYWADLRYPDPLPDPGAEDRSALEEGVVRDDLDPAALVEETLAEAHESMPVSPDSAPSGTEAPPAKVDHLDPWLQEMAYVADAVVSGEAALTEALWLPRAARIAVFRALVKHTFVDVYAYFFGGDGEAMRGRLRARLDAIAGPVIVIGHSLGSIIAYDVLRETARDVPLFVTIGSPLGVTEIQDLVTSPLQVPHGVQAWRNVADGRDLVALDRTIRPEYVPPDRTLDFLVVNDSPTHHGALEYVASQPVRSAVAALTA